MNQVKNRFIWRAGFIALFLAAALSGCFYTRLMQLKGQLAKYDKNFKTGGTDEFSITALNPVLLQDDLLKLEMIPTEKIGGSWQYVFIKQYAAEASEKE